MDNKKVEIGASFSKQAAKGKLTLGFYFTIGALLEQGLENPSALQQVVNTPVKSTDNPLLCSLGPPLKTSSCGANLRSLSKSMQHNAGGLQRN